jgi:phosphate-selective porin OprO and OprP
MLKRHWGMLATAAMFAAGPAGAQTAGDTRQIDRLEGQIQALQREVGDLKEKALTAEKNTYAAAPAPSAAATTPVAAPTAIATMSPNYRPSICTPDQQNCISLTGVLQFDFGGYNYRPATGLGIAATGVPIAPSTVPQQLDDGVNVRRGRIGVLGKFMSDWNYALIYDFGNSSDGFGGLAPGSLPGGGMSGLENAYLSYTGFKPFAIEGGYMVVLIRSTSPPAPTTSCSWSAHRPR